MSLLRGLRRSRTNYLGAALACGGLALIGLVAWNIGRRLNQAGPKALREEDAKRDKTLKDSFPASDPPASQFFDIPVNRQ